MGAQRCDHPLGASIVVNLALAERADDALAELSHALAVLLAHINGAVRCHHDGTRRVEPGIRDIAIDALHGLPVHPRPAGDGGDVSLTVDAPDQALPKSAT